MSERQPRAKNQVDQPPERRRNGNASASTTEGSPRAFWLVLAAIICVTALFGFSLARARRE